MAEPRPGTRSAAATWAGFVAMALGMFMAVLDVQIVATSLPTIEAALALRAERMSWIQTAYLIAEVVAIPLTGILTRWLGMRRLFTGALALFTVASIGCAGSDGFAALIAWRVVQGLAGGTLIPAVFAAVFLLFAPRRQALATTIGGLLAVLAPTLGPLAGGWITDAFSWRWLFLVNVAPGIAAVAVGALALPRAPIDRAQVAAFDAIGLGGMIAALVAFELALKRAPEAGWFGAEVLGLLGASLGAALVFRHRARHRERPAVPIGLLADRRLALGCGLSFGLGMGLFGQVYLMPVFLAFVRQHEALEIGRIMLVTGLAQLVAAPVTVVLERRVEARVLTVAGFLLLALGLGLGGFHSRETDFDAMILPQLVRGAAIMLCLLAPTRIALGHIAAASVADASALYNLMRNLGGAVALAAIDTVLYGHGPVLADRLGQRLLAGDESAARVVGIPLALFRERIGRPVDAETLAAVQPLVERAGLVAAINEAWTMLAAVAVLSLGAVVWRWRDAAAR